MSGWAWSQQCTCIFNEADGLLGYTEGDSGQERDKRCFSLLRLMSSTTDSCYMSTVCPPSIVMARFASLVNWWRRKGELPRWSDILVSKLCFATNKTRFAPCAQSHVCHYHSHRFAAQILYSNFLFLHFSQALRLCPCSDLSNDSYHCFMLLLEAGFFQNSGMQFVAVPMGPQSCLSEIKYSLKTFTE